MIKEKVLLATIYKQDGLVHIEPNDIDACGFELLGFLRCYTKLLEKELRGQFTKT